MYRDQVIALLKDKLTLEVQTVGYYDYKNQYKNKHVINLCLSGEPISTIDLKEL